MSFANGSHGRWQRHDGRFNLNQYYESVLDDEYRYRNFSRHLCVDAYVLCCATICCQADLDSFINTVTRFMTRRCFLQLGFSF